MLVHQECTWNANSTNITEKTTQATVSHELHRERRRSMNKFFSRAQVYQLENVIQTASQKLSKKILSYKGGNALCLAPAYSCFTADVISEYSFGESFGFLDQPGWEPNYKTSVDILFGFVHIFKLFPFLRYLIELIPLCISKLASQDIGLVMHDLKVGFPHKIALARSYSEAESLGGHRTTIFSSLLHDPELPPSEKATDRLASEANSIMIGGTESTAVTLSLLTYHLLANPGELEIIRAEINTVSADEQGMIPGVMLEKLPYFTAAIQEALRLVHGISGRAARIAPNEDLIYQRPCDSPEKSQGGQDCIVIPRGYAIGMSAYLLHTDPQVFPEPHQFRPKRWLDKNGQRNRDLDKHLFSFGKGSRQCVGMQ
ncbi:trichodiene oxygenase [Fusarium austroafricanum]|uniref:Trichodiene oxygenase n=1 Tax=Fusarium austroafricanum TaxID=2364996 RepID=A0A8H4P4K0_9HYPO|nr:trichodiene oxygenase [Fusarium austroafricanum]